MGNRTQGEEGGMGRGKRKTKLRKINKKGLVSGIYLLIADTIPYFRYSELQRDERGEPKHWGKRGRRREREPGSEFGGRGCPYHGESGGEEGDNTFHPGERWGNDGDEDVGRHESPSDTEHQGICEKPTVDVESFLGQHAG